MPPIDIKCDTRTRDTYIQNIIQTWDDADFKQKRKGRNWYPVAHQLALMIGDGNPAKGAGVIAALSAQASWARNQHMAQTLIETGTVGTTGERLRKATAILDGTPPEDVLPMEAKTGQFYLCILNPDDPNPVVVDRHSHDLSVGEVYGDTGRGLSAKGRYALIANCYRAAATGLGEIPSVVQAVCWTVHVDRTAHLPHRAARQNRPQ